MNVKEESTKTMLDELSKMNESVSDPEGVEEDTSTDDTGTGEGEEDNKGEEEENTDTDPSDSSDDSATDTPDLDDPSTDDSDPKPEQDPEPDELTLLREENLQLKAERDKKASADEPSDLEEEDPPTEPSDDKPADSEPSFTPENFVGDMDLDDLSRDPEALNELLNNVYRKGIDSSRSQIITGNESVLKSIPDIVKTNLALITNLTKASKDFYEENQDLVPWKKAVASVFEEVSARNPDKSHTENLKTTSTEVRKRLKLKDQAISKDKNKNGKGPRLPKSKGNKRQSEKPSTKGIESEIEAMNKIL